MKKIFVIFGVAVLFAVLVTAGCVSGDIPDPNQGGLSVSDPVVGTWHMAVEDDYVRYYDYLFSSDLTGKETLYYKETNEILSEETFTWIRINDSYRVTYDSDHDIHEVFGLSKDGKVLSLDKYNFTFHKL